MEASIHLTSLGAMGIVALYLAFTAPFLPLLLYVHRLQSSYTGILLAALVLQLLPIGLLFFPLGFIGVGMLAYTLVGTHHRNRAFERNDFANADVHARWIREYLANLWAFGFALEQKGVALVFVQVTSRQGYAGLWEGLLPGSLLLWALLGPLIGRELKALARYSSAQR